LPPLCVEPVLFHHPSETLERRELLTLDHGLSAVTAKFDLANPVVKTSPKPYQPKTQLAQYGPESHGALGPNASDAEKKVASLISDLGKKTRDPTRTYQDLLDMYSLHEFIIRRGKTLSSTPEFLSYQRSFPKEWAGIQLVIKALEELLLEYAIPLAYIDGKKVAALAVKKMKGYTNDELVECIANRDEVVPLINKPHRSAKLTKAATTIQATFRMYRQRCRYLDLCYRNECARIIQKMWHSHRRHSNTRSLILQHQFELEDAWRQLQDQFIRDWDIIVTRPRVIIHVPSLSYTEQQVKSMPYLGCQQNGQMARLCDLVDQNVEILYIAPYPLERETITYHERLMMGAGVQNVEARVTIMHPENHKRVARGMSLTRSILCSDRLLKRISAFIKGKTAYIVPGVVGPEDLTLAAKLMVPLLGTLPGVRGTFCTKSGAKRVFEAADVVTPIGVHDLYRNDELLSMLAKYVLRYPEFPRWLLKINHEFQGRGTAYVDVKRLKTLQMKDNVQPGEMDIEELRSQLRVELAESIAKRVKLVSPHLYSDWDAFLQAFMEYGGVLEAVPGDVVGSPTAHLFIHPSGKVELTCVQEQVFASPYVVQGATFPQTLVPHAAIRDAVVAIGAACRQKGIMGYVSVDFVLYKKDKKDYLPRLWAVGLEVGPTNNAVAHRLFATICNSPKVDEDTGELFCSPYPGARPEPRCYVYSGLTYHPYISSIRHGIFFGLCKQKGISFDVQERTGTLFQMPDTLLKNCIGTLCMGRNSDEAISHFWCAIELLYQQLGDAAALTYQRDESNLQDVVEVCKELNRRRLGVVPIFATNPIKTVPRKPVFGLQTMTKVTALV